MTKTISHDQECGEIVTYECAEPGCAATYTGYDCGHEYQPVPVAPDIDGRPRCDEHCIIPL